MPFDPLPRTFLTALARCAARGGAALDLGCGDGALARIMARHGVPSIGLDLLPPAGGSTAHVVGDALAPPVAAGSCTLVVAANLVRHLAPRRPELDFVADWASLLDDGGELFLFEDLPDESSPASRNFGRLQAHLAAAAPWARGPLLSRAERRRLEAVAKIAVVASGRQENRWRLDADAVVAFLAGGDPQPGTPAAALLADIRRDGIGCGAYWWACVKGVA